MLRFDLGDYSFSIKTQNPEAQVYFDQGLNWCFGFNQEEGLACFEQAIKIDPTCAMAHWGAAYAAGPFYNMPWPDFTEAEAEGCTAFCRGHIDKAQELVEENTLEARLVTALAQRIQKPHVVTAEEFKAWDDAYADAMRSINTDYPDNLDIMALFIEAMMTRTPWKMWDVKTNEPPANTDTYEAIEVCERAIRLADDWGIAQHPAILHLHIHLLEMSLTPERAMDSADRLGGLCPDAGHIHHMPGHIYVLCGEYEKAKIASEKAIEVDRKYLAYAGPHNYYTTARCHDLHLMMYACMFLGQFDPAWAAAEEMCATLTPDVIDLPGKPYIAGTMEGYFSVKMHVLIRFGKWQMIVDTPMPEDLELYCVSTAMHHYAKGVAHAALKNFEEADQEVKAFYASLNRIGPKRKFFNNTALQTLAVGEKMMLGEVAYHKGHYEEAYDHLRESVRRCDDMEYSEPWGWMHPPRHALGALLMEQDHYEEAEAVYRADLGLNDEVQRCAQHKDNVWALHGIVECLRHRGETVELPELQQRLIAAQAKTDVPITSSCCCRTKIASDMAPA
ncbi:tetratricopeptide repeat protein [Cochlodiniinecator piscidefendens]|uniref:hypothetical protein n=1 Tax=Cochlodiniinecator piscidefendens TaxID=2715756 RepID=UPI0014094962|nr:hypothetical protein [Cochlodiniinecator piscidefendens]